MSTQTPIENQNADAQPSCASKCKIGSIVKYTLALLVAVVGAICVAAYFRPDNFRYARSATFKASPAALFEQVNDFHKWDAWSPWAKMDPKAKATFDGPYSGEGAKFAWDGNSDVGAGNMEIIESKPNEVVRIRLAFIRPMQGPPADVEMKIEPQGDETKLTWTMTGENVFLGKVFGLFVDCEKMCGDMFSQGLENMRKIVEAEPAKPAEGEAAAPNAS